MHQATGTPVCFLTTDRIDIPLAGAGVEARLAEMVLRPVIVEKDAVRNVKKHPGAQRKSQRGQQGGEGKAESKTVASLKGTRGQQLVRMADSHAPVGGVELVLPLELARGYDTVVPNYQRARLAAVHGLGEIVDEQH